MKPDYVQANMTEEQVTTIAEQIEKTTEAIYPIRTESKALSETQKIVSNREMAALNAIHTKQSWIQLAYKFPHLISVIA